MAAESSSFSFLHAADFYLDAIPDCLSTVPDDLREAIIDSTYNAVERVVDTALAQQVTFAVLSGDLLCMDRSGPRSVAFLIQQFERLLHADIAVYWAAGTTDSKLGWPDEIQLPPNVFRFRRGRIEERVHTVDERPIVRIIGAGRDPNRRLRTSDYQPEEGDLYTIAIVHGRIKPNALVDHGVDYWALGGRHDRHTLADNQTLAHYAGRPQGLDFSEPGSHGCTIVRVDRTGQTQLQSLTTDRIRWHDLAVQVDKATTQTSLESALFDEAAAVIDMADETDLLVRWTLTGRADRILRLYQDNIDTKLLKWLRDNFAGNSPALWSESLDLSFDDDLPDSWYEQETIRGDYLRSVRQSQSKKATPIDLTEYLPAEADQDLVEQLAGKLSPSAGERLLRDITLRGANLLTAKEQLP